jgi:hypothetical protein
LPARDESGQTCRNEGQNGLRVTIIHQSPRWNANLLSSSLTTLDWLREEQDTFGQRVFG